MSPASLPPCSWTMLTALLLALGAAAVAAAGEEVPTWQAAPVRLVDDRGSERRLLDRLERFFKDAQWDEAFDLAAQILATERSLVVATGGERYVGMHERCHQLLSHLPAGSLGHYRELVDEAVEVWYRRGVAQRHEPLLRRIVDLAFCSSWGDAALWALGELALERGEYAEARRYWQRISPELTRFSDVLSYPDSKIDLADVRARLLLVSVRAQDWERAARELGELEAKHPEARGRLGGREVIYAKHLAELLNRSREIRNPSASTDWSTFAGTPTRASALGIAAARYQKHFSLPLSAPYETLPLVVDGQLVYQELSSIRAVELATGAQRFATAHEDFVPTSQLAWRQPVHAITAARHQIFGASNIPLGLSHNTPKKRPVSGLWGIDLERDGAWVLRVPSEDPSVSFASVLTAEPGKLLVALRANDRTARAGIGCYDLSRQRWNWQRWLCLANSPATGWTQDVATTLLTTDGGTAAGSGAGIVYLVTNLGAIAAVRVADGRIVWLRTYERIAAPLAAAGSCAYYRGPNPGIYHRGRLFVLPTDGKQLLALDAATGAVEWHRALASEEALLSGAHDGKLVLVDGGLTILNAANGELIGASAALRLEGRAAIVNERILWPSGGKIHWLDLATGKPAQEALPLPESGPANLVVGGDYLIAAQPSQITVYDKD